MYRRLTQIAFILFIFLMPVLDIFRYDVAAHELIIFGHVWGLGLNEAVFADHSPGGAAHVALRFFLRAILPWLAILALFPLLGFLTGRLFCGWLCPEGTLFELADHLTQRLLGRRSLFVKKPNDSGEQAGSRGLTILLVVVSLSVLPVLGGIALTGYFVAPKTIWHQIMTWNCSFGVKAGIIGVSIYMVLTSVLIRHSLCKYICAAGLMQMLFGWVSPVSLRIRMDSGRVDECTNCRGCEKACFMNVLPRMNRRDISCVNCGACVEACRRELGPEKGLFDYRFGEGLKDPDPKKKISCAVSGRAENPCQPH